MTRREALSILGLDTDASLKDVKNAYRKLVNHFHPDKNSAHIVIDINLAFWLYIIYTIL